MDECTKKIPKRQQDKLEPRQIPLPTPTQKAYLQLSSTLVANNIHLHISLHFFAPKMEKRMSRISSIPTHQRSQIHWRAFEWAYKRLSVIARLSIFKLIHNKWYPAAEIAKCDPDDPCRNNNARISMPQHIGTRYSTNYHRSHRAVTGAYTKGILRPQSTKCVSYR